jgi:hypothetical protein
MRYLLPWMRPDNPALRYWRNLPQVDSRPARYRRAFTHVVLLVLLLGIGYGAASDGFSADPLAKPFAQLLFDGLFWPGVILQILWQIYVILSSVGSFGDLSRRQSWDNLRVTSGGVDMALRARWSAILFYRLRGFPVLIYLIRLLLIAGLLYDLSAFEGEYLRHLLDGTQPPLSQAASIGLLTCGMVASLLLPLTGAGFDAALGLYLATFLRQRVYLTLVQSVFLGLRLVLIGLVLVAGLTYQITLAGVPNWQIWTLLLLFTVAGDWGLSLLYLGVFAVQMWLDVPYSIFLGLAALVIILIQAALADRLLSFAIRRAERSG